VILAAGLTPAWQQIMRFAHVRPGEVNRAAEVYWCASGKVLNVGTALACLGARSHTLSPAGGWSGAALRAECAAQTTWTAVQAPTRVCTTLLDCADKTTTELVENAAPLSADELAAFVSDYQRLVRDARMVVLTGSLPYGTPASFYRDLLATTSCPVVLDARGPELLAALARKPRVVKPNREELALTVGRKLATRAEILSAMAELIERGAQGVIVTQGKDAVLVMEGTHAWELMPVEVEHVENPIGCGDCFAAALALGLAQDDTLMDAARLGIAAAADNVAQLLPARLDRARVLALCDRVRAPKQITS
jgi:tagatose 6-phosphate kinase